jgi:hypothetical protein
MKRLNAYQPTYHDSMSERLCSCITSQTNFRPQPLRAWGRPLVVMLPYLSMEYLPIRERQCWPLQGFKRAGVHYQITVAMDTADPPLDELAELHRGGYRLKSWK